MAQPEDLIRNIGEIQLKAMDNLWGGDPSLMGRKDDYSGFGSSMLQGQYDYGGAGLGVFGQSMASGAGLGPPPNQVDGSILAMNELNTLKNTAANNAVAHVAQIQTQNAKLQAQAAAKQAERDGVPAPDSVDTGDWGGNPFAKPKPVFNTSHTGLYNEGGSGGTGPIDASSAQMFAQSFTPYARAAAAKLGIDPAWVIAMSASESNYGKADAAGHELFGVKALPGQPGTVLGTHEGANGGVATNQTFAAYDSPQSAVDAWVDLLQNHYKGALNAKDLPTFVHGLKQGGYFTAGEGEYLGIVQGIMNRPDIQAGYKAAGNSPQNPAQSGSGAPYQINRQSQFGLGLSKAEAEAFCGPAAAMALAQYYGNNIPLETVRQYATQVGWNTGRGMAGAQSEVNLLGRMGVNSQVEGWNEGRAQQLMASGSPVIIDTPGHYFVADAYDPKRGYHVGTSGTDLRLGSDWMTPQQMAALAVAGAPRSLIYGMGGGQVAPSTPGAPVAPADPKYLWGR